MKLGKSLFILTMVAALATLAVAQSVQLVNVDRNKLALEGYDPIAFHDGQKTKGDKAITAKHLGATYRFATEANRDRFLADPDGLAPAYGGYCAYAAAKNSLAKVDLDTASVVDGRLYFNYSKSVAKKWRADQAEYIKKADANWPKLVSKHGK